MHTLAVLFLGMRFYAHRAHNVCKGDTFFQDHDFFGGLYETYDDAYDAVIERMIGLGKEEVDIPAITQKACSMFCKSGKDNATKQFYQHLLASEELVCDSVKDMMKGATDGTQNLLQGLADQSESRQYKIRQRLK